jgi:putative ABC transport system ATP-binding protein
LLEARSICRTSREGRSLLSNVNLRIGDGDRVAMTGPTGSGKSLLLRALALIDPIDSGEILWNEKPVADREIPEFRGQVIYLQQRPTLMEGTVEENLRMPFAFKAHQRRTFDRDTVRERLAGLERSEHFLEQDVAHLSGGERQIVAVLRALALAPSLLLLDEPTAALDAASTQQIETTILHWLDESAERACVWVTHNVEQAARVGNREARIQAGTLIEPGAVVDAR